MEIDAGSDRSHPLRTELRSAGDEETAVELSSAVARGDISRRGVTLPSGFLIPKLVFL